MAAGTTGPVVAFDADEQLGSEALLLRCRCTLLAANSLNILDGRAGFFTRGSLAGP